jgi:hypothetical protein
MTRLNPGLQVAQWVVSVYVAQLAKVVAQAWFELIGVNPEAQVAHTVADV